MRSLKHFLPMKALLVHTEVKNKKKSKVQVRMYLENVQNIIQGNRQRQRVHCSACYFFPTFWPNCQVNKLLF